MKKYSNIPIKERKRNADRCYRHEVSLEERQMKHYIKEKEIQFERENTTDKDRECNEVYKRLKAIEKGVL